jgi:outer membrane lipoprotein-sorting protein
MLVLMTDLTPVRSPLTRWNRRWLVPAGAVVLTAAGVVVAALPGVASGSDHPPLPARTAAQLLADLHGLTPPPFSGTVVETARLGLPSLPSGDLHAAAGASAGSVEQILTLLTGSHTAQVSYGGPTLQRIALFTGDSSETDVVHNGKDVWTYQSDGNAVTHFALPADTKDGKDSADPTDGGASAVPALTPQEEAQHVLAAIDPSTAVTVDLTARVADRPAYQLDLRPKGSGSTISSVRIAIDAATHIPLRVQIWGTATSSSPAFEVGYTDFSLSAPGARTFAFSVPAGAKVTDEAAKPKAGDTGKPAAGKEKPSVVGKDWTSVLVVPADPSTSTAPKSGSATSGLLNDLSTPIAGGRLIHTSLLNVVLADDGRMAVGAVDPSLLSQALVSQALGAKGTG